MKNTMDHAADSERKDALSLSVAISIFHRP
jgi:hypothetical protein